MLKLTAFVYVDVTTYTVCMERWCTCLGQYIGIYAQITMHIKYNQTTGYPSVCFFVYFVLCGLQPIGQTQALQHTRKVGRKNGRSVGDNEMSFLLQPTVVFIPL